MIINNTQLTNNSNQYSIVNQNVRSLDKLANNVPNGLIKITEPQFNKNINNNLNTTNLRQIYTSKLAPSTGSFTENFLKSRSTMSPVYKFNEAATKYEMTSTAPLFLKQVKKSIDLII